MEQQEETKVARKSNEEVRREENETENGRKDRNVNEQENKEIANGNKGRKKYISREQTKCRRKIKEERRVG